MSAYRMGLTGDAAQLTMGRTEAERSSQCFEDRNDAFGRCLTNFTFPAYIYLRFFTPKIWHFLISRGKNFGGVFFDVF
jgi:hypothetical protein